MNAAIDETTRRREFSESVHLEHGIVPQTIIKPIEATLVTAPKPYTSRPLELEDIEAYSPQQSTTRFARLEFEMREHAKNV